MICLPHDGRALLDGFHGVLDLVESTLRGPGRDVAVILVPELKKQIVRTLRNSFTYTINFKESGQEQRGNSPWQSEMGHLP